MSILFDQKNDVIDKIKKERTDIIFVKELRTNMTSVHLIKIEENEYILKFVLINTPNQLDQTQNDYDMQRFQIMLSCGKTSVFPLIIETFTILIKAHLFGVIIEEHLQYSFFQGAKKIYGNCNNHPIKTTIFFMQKLIDLYWCYSVDKDVNLDRSKLNHL